ncbi:uncharacterized protein LOC143294951 [Babylonia areolata]|uniref:uncharacterized protein LOC143294951 n=1 Tax=Babylonia areolata TaxID=304850 RepID=UPI003FD16F71
MSRMGRTLNHGATLLPLVISTLGALTLVLSGGGHQVAATGMAFHPVAQRSHSHQNITEGESGVRCTHIHRHCLTDIPCIKEKCVCPEGFKGNGEFECIENANFLCVVSADPHVFAFGGARSDVDLPCRYRLTRFVTDHRTAATPHAYCSVEVYATNELNLGQYYVRSVHISLGITDSGQQVHEQFEIKKFGVSDDQIFQFLSNVNKTRTLWGFSLHETINGVDVFPTFDKDNNFAVLWVPECGTRIKYRAYDRTRHRQPLLPGVSIMAPSDMSFVTGYGHYPHSLCGTDKDDRQLYNRRAKELGLRNRDEAVIFDILSEMAPQQGNPKELECVAAMQAFKNSQNKVADVRFCAPILTNTKTRKCVVKGGPQPIEAFTICLNFRQFGLPADCNALNDIRAACGDRWKGPAFSC